MMMKEQTKTDLRRLAGQRAIKEKATFELIDEFVTDPVQRTKLQRAFQDALMYAADERNLLASNVDTDNASYYGTPNVGHQPVSRYAKLIGQ